MIRRWRGAALVAAMTVTGLGCTGSTTEPQVADALVAVAVNGEPLPATAINWPDYHLELLADTIRLTWEGYTQRRVERFTGFIGVPEIRETGTAGSVRFDGRSITLEPYCDALFCRVMVLVQDGGTYRETWRPTEGVEVVVEYRPILEDGTSEP